MRISISHGKKFLLCSLLPSNNIFHRIYYVSSSSCFFSDCCDAIVQLIKSTQYPRLAQSPAQPPPTSFHFAPLQILYTHPHTHINRTQTMPEICVQCGERCQHPNPNACVWVRAATEERRVIYMTNIVCAVRWNENLLHKHKTWLCTGK